MKKDEEIWSLIDNKQAIYIDLADKIFDIPEILYKEFKSVSKHTQILKKQLLL